LSAKSEPTSLEHKGNSYTSEIYLHDKPSSTETVDLSLPSPAGDELTVDQPTYAYSSSSNDVAGHYGHPRFASGSPATRFQDHLDYSIPQGSPAISAGLSRIDISSQFPRHDNQLQPTSATSVDISGDSPAWSPTQESSRSHKSLTAPLSEEQLKIVVQGPGDIEWRYEMRRECQEILPGLLLGPFVASKSLETLQSLNITHMYSV
jgi:hypothetical protein